MSGLLVKVTCFSTLFPKKLLKNESSNGASPNSAARLPRFLADRQKHR